MSRYSITAQILIVVLYIGAVLIAKHFYDNHRRSNRFEQYHSLAEDVSETLKMVEKHVKDTAVAEKSLGVLVEENKKLDQQKHKKQMQIRSHKRKTKPP